MTLNLKDFPLEAGAAFAIESLHPDDVQGQAVEQPIQEIGSHP